MKLTKKSRYFILYQWGNTRNNNKNLTKLKKKYSIQIFFRIIGHSRTTSDNIYKKFSLYYINGVHRIS